MYPIICKIGPLVIYSYGLMLVIGFSIAAFLMSKQAKTQGLDPELIYNLCFFVLISGIIGSRVLFILLNLDYYLSYPLEMVMFANGGLAWFGGLVAGALACLFYIRKKHLDTYAVLDLVAPFLALGQAAGRLGCFLNGCCFGKESLDFGIYSHVHGMSLIPAQLYSCLALVAIYGVLRIKQLQHHQKGEIAYSYFFLYSAWRFFIEFFRGDTRIFIFGLSIFQMFSICLLIFSGIMLLSIKKQH